MELSDTAAPPRIPEILSTVAPCPAAAVLHVSFILSRSIFSGFFLTVVYNRVLSSSTFASDIIFPEEAGAILSQSTAGGRSICISPK